jgi:hypothetical protein
VRTLDNIVKKDKEIEGENNEKHTFMLFTAPAIVKLTT